MQKMVILLVMTTLALMILGCASEKNTSSASTATKNITQPEPHETPLTEPLTMEQPMTEKTPAAQPRVKLTTSKGEILIELNEQKAPETVKNFLQYVNEGFYNGTIFHRVIPGFMAQCGGFTPDMGQKSTHSPIHNESNNGLRNDRGTLAMARTNDLNSATSQFFINVADNKFLNYPNNGGYAVFGNVISGMDVVDAIVAVKRGRSGPHDDVPAEPIIIEKAEVVAP